MFEDALLNTAVSSLQDVGDGGCSLEDSNMCDFDLNVLSTVGLIRDLESANVNPLAATEVAAEQMMHQHGHTAQGLHQQAGLGASGMTLKRKRQWKGEATNSSSTSANNVGNPNAPPSSSVTKLELDSQRADTTLNCTANKGDFLDREMMREEKRAKLFPYSDPTQGITAIPMMSRSGPSPMSTQQVQPAHLHHHYVQSFSMPSTAQVTQPALTQPIYGQPIRTSNSDMYHSSQELYLMKKPGPTHHYLPQQAVLQRVPSQQPHQVRHIQIHHQHVQRQKIQHPHLDKNFTVPPSITNLGESSTTESLSVRQMASQELVLPSKSEKIEDEGSSTEESPQKPKKAKGKSSPKTNCGEKVDITHLLKYPQSQAAQLLNMSQATFSKRFREANNKRWPYRRLIVLEKQLKTAISEGDRASAEALEAATKQLLSGCFIYKK